MQTPNEILVATGNAHKLQEIQSILPAIKFKSLKDVGIDIDILEDGSSFEENALKKAMAIAQLSDDMVLADDSGLVVNALNGAPGIYSARYAGENASDTENNKKLLKMLQGQLNRQAHFACSLVLVHKTNVIFTGTGICEGNILETANGSGGFGYDPLFIPKGYNNTFANLGEEIKNKISHRAKAMQLLKSFLNT